MGRTRFDPELPPKLLAQFFAQPRQPGDRFWTTRAIMRRFGVSLFVANVAVQALVRQGVLERKPRVGTFVAAPSGVALPTVAAASPSHVGVVWPAWAAESERNPWTTALRTALAEDCHRRRWRFSLFQEPGQLDDLLFPGRFRATGCNRLLLLSPSEEGVVPLAKLRDAGLAMVSIGELTPAFGLLKLRVVDGDDEEAMRRLVLQLRREGCRRLLVVGYNNPVLGTDRVRGCVSAFEQFAHDYPADTFVESRDEDYLVATVAQRLAGRSPVGAIIFENHLAFLAAWERVPLLQQQLHTGLRVAVINEYYLRQRFPLLPLIEVTMNPRVLARTALEVLDGCARGERPGQLTLLPYDIVWPAGRQGASASLRDSSA